MSPSGVVSSTIAVGDEGGPHGTGRLLYRSPAAVGYEEGGSVRSGGSGDRSVLVQNLESIELCHVLVLVTDIWIELFQGEVLEIPDPRRRVRVDSDRVPCLQDLCPQ